MRPVGKRHLSCPVLPEAARILESLCVICRGRPTDVYALGACLFTFLYGRIPFNAPNVFKLFQVTLRLQPCLAGVTLSGRRHRLLPACHASQASCCS